MPSQGQGKRRAAQETEKPVKRTRVSRACDQCRLAREKCDGTQPTCSTCANARRSCTYAANVKKRGIQPGYIRALELALAFLFQHDPQNESRVHEKLVHEGPSSLILSRDSKESNKLHKRWRKARFYTDVDRLLSGGEPSRQNQSEPLSPDSDEDSDVDVGTVQTTTVNDSTSSLQESHISSHQPNIAPTQPDSSRYTMPLESWKLLETYFDLTQCWLPVCEKHDMLKLSYSYPIEGLALSPKMTDSGSHAELWSILALASLHGSDKTGHISVPNELYNTARLLIPDERGPFYLGHIKALLNLAVFNITQSHGMAARILVGLAHQLLEARDNLSIAELPRYKHVRYGCFILDSMLAIQTAGQRLSRESGLKRLGPIDEEGLDEWQPWTGSEASNSTSLARTPLLGLSTFNALTGLVELMTNGPWPSQNSAQSLEVWKAALPPKLSYIREDAMMTPLTPPAVLLRVTYGCALFTWNPSSIRLRQILNVVEQAREQLGLTALPPTIGCLIQSVYRCSKSITIDQTSRQRLDDLRRALILVPTESTAEEQDPRRKSSFYATPSVGALQTPISQTALDHPQYSDSVQPIIAPFDHSLTDLYTSPAMIEANRSSRDIPIAPGSDARFPEMSTDLESFFDELASLDSTKNLDNQPQFMQNLGFAPDANMADLFSEYIPLQSSAFLLQQDPMNGTQDHYSLFAGS